MIIFDTNAKTMINRSKITLILLYAITESLIFSNFYKRDITWTEVILSIISLFIFIIQLQVGFSENIILNRIKSISNPISLLYLIIYFIVIPLIISPIFINKYEYDKNSWSESMLDFDFINYLMSLFTAFNFYSIIGVIYNRGNKSTINYSQKIKFKPGDLVNLKTGGPTMVVGTASASDHNSVINYKCSWIDHNSNKPYEAVFTEEQLMSHNEY